MANDQSVGVSERFVYGAIIFSTAKLVQNGYITADMQAYIAGGIVTFAGGAWAWWRNRPGVIMDRAAAQVPASSKLVIATDVNAPNQEKDAAHILAESAGEKVTAAEVKTLAGGLIQGEVK